MIPCARVSEWTAIALALVFAVGASVSSQAAVIPTSGLKAWLRADNIDGAGNATLTDGATFSSWSDSHTSGNDASQVSASLQPEYVADGLNGKPVAHFSGDALPFDSLRMPELIDATIFMVLRSDNTGGFALSADNPAHMRHSIGNGILGATGLAYATKHTTNSQTPVGSGNPADTGRWSVVASRLDDQSSGVDAGTPLELFVAGNYFSTPIPDGVTIAENNYRVQLGSRSSTGSNALDGDIAEVLVYDRALSDHEVLALNRYLSDKFRLPVSPRLLAYYSYEPPDVPTDNQAFDESLNGRDGALAALGGGSFDYVGSAPVGIGSAQALQLTQSGSDAARLALGVSTAELNLSTEDWTVATWFNRSGQADLDFLFHLGTGDGFGGDNELYAYFDAGSDELRLQHFPGPADIDLRVGGVDPGAWHHLAVVHDTALAEMLLYVDGELAGLDDQFDLDINQDGNAVIFGGHPAGSNLDRLFNGLLDDSALWARALNGSEIRDLYLGLQTPLNVAFVIPEPSTWALLALGGAILGARGLRRRAWTTRAGRRAR